MMRGSKSQQSLMKLPKIAMASSIEHKSKLLEPQYLLNIKTNNSRLQDSISHNNSIIHQQMITSNRDISQLSPTKSTLFFKDLQSHNFGQSCDKGFVNQSKHHKYQKFGRLRNIKLKPLQNKILPTHSLLKIFSIDQIEVDMRNHYKQAFFDKIPFLFIFRSFEISHSVTFKQEPKISKSYKLDFGETIRILKSLGNSVNSMVSFFKDNLELDRNNLPILKEDYLKILNEYHQDLEGQDLPHNLIIESKDETGYYQIKFPTAEFYVPHEVYQEKLILNHFQVIDLIKNQFDEIKNSFNRDKYEDTLSVKLEEIQKLKEDERLKEEEKKYYQPHSLSRLHDDELIAILIVDDPETFIVDDALLKKVIKCSIHNSTQDNYYSIKFVASSIVVREQRHEKILKSHYFNMKEFTQLIQITDLQQFLDHHVEVLIPKNKQNQIASTQSIEEGRDKFSIKVVLPEVPIQDDFKLSEEHHEAFKELHRDMEINTQFLTMTLVPPRFYVHEHVSCKTQIKNVTAHHINQMIEKGWNFGMQLI